MLAAILLGAASGAGGQAIEGAIAMSQGIALQQSINFTRSQEIEADCGRHPAAGRRRLRSARDGDLLRVAGPQSKAWPKAKFRRCCRITR